MKLNEIYGKEDGLKISFEVFPPKGGEVEYPELLKELECLEKYKPALVSLTWGASGNNNNSFELIKILNEKYNLMPHLTCVCNNLANIEELINNIKDCNIDNILALRGDKPQEADTCHSDFHYANELVRFIKTKSSLSVAVAGYPEGHIEAVDLSSDIDNLKKKVDEGAEAVYTQLFFDNEKYFSFVDRCKSEGIDVPIIPGIKPINFRNQLTVLPKVFHVDLPEALASELRKCKTDEEAKEVGVEWCILQAKELKEKGVPSIHFYSMMATESVKRVARQVY
mgnify:CR=1 FL=1